LAALLDWYWFLSFSRAIAKARDLKLNRNIIEILNTYPLTFFIYFRVRLEIDYLKTLKHNGQVLRLCGTLGRYSLNSKALETTGKAEYKTG